MRERLADSRFDIIRLFFRSDITESGRSGWSSEAEGDFLFALVRSGSSEPELELVMGSSSMRSKTEERSGKSHGVVPPSTAAKGLPEKGGRVDNMVAVGQSFCL